MTESSLTQLSDFFADVVESIFVRMTEKQVCWLIEQSELYEQVWSTKQSLYKAQMAGEVVDEFFFEIICNTAEVDLMKIGRHLDVEELHLELAHVQPVPDSTPPNLLLVYRIKVGEVALGFNCQAGTDGVFNYHLKSLQSDVNIDDMWDYYFKHTPCAVI